MYSKDDLIEIRFSDWNRNIYFKRKAQLNNKRELMELFLSLEKFDINIEEIAREIRKSKGEELSFWNSK